MSPVALLTPTYERDLDRRTLPCESVDRHVFAAPEHVLQIPDADLSHVGASNPVPLSIKPDEVHGRTPCHARRQPGPAEVPNALAELAVRC